MKMWFNEEEIKNKIIVPFLKSCGFDVGELQFEKRFRIHLGRGSHEFEGKACSEVSGRLDVLCRRDGRNLFVVEIKAQGVELTDADRIQGLTYARLLEPMAPYVLLSNGERTMVFDTISGTEVRTLRKDTVEGRLAFPDVDEELALRFEALKNFIGMSYSNLLSFCKGHNRQILEFFRADPTEPISQQIMKNYIPSVYVAREDLERTFLEFLKQKKHCVFPIVGESGVGKTNTMCHLVEEASKEYPVLFYSGSVMGASFWETLAFDFNLVFTSEETPLRLLKRIASLTERHRKPFCIFIDAIDEWIAHDKAVQLNDLVKLASEMDMRLCISCKAHVWDSFLTRQGVPTRLSANLFPSVPKMKFFGLQEARNAAEAYCKLLDVNLSSFEIPDELRNPFLLRVASEVAYIDRMPLNSTIDSRAVLERYVHLKLGRMPHSEIARRFLKGIATCLLKYGSPHISEEYVRKELNLSMMEDIPADLFSFSILYRYVDENKRTSVGYYFSALRDHEVAVDVLELDRLCARPRVEKIKSALKSYVGKSAVIWFFKTGNDSEQADCLKAVVEIDQEGDRSSAASMLLSYYGKYMNEEVKAMYQQMLIDHLKSTFKTNKENHPVAEQVAVAMGNLGKSPEVEDALVSLFEIYLMPPTPDFAIAAHIIAKLLRRMEDRKSTLKLVDLASNPNNDGYVRRYIIESLEKRSGFDRRALFLNLMKDPDPNVRRWTSSWYEELEDQSLRDEILNIVDDGDDHVAISAVRTLSGSRLDDTGKLLFERFLLGQNMSERLAAWLCRTLADLNYRDAIPKFIELLKTNPDSLISEHILIALGELKATETVSTLLEIIKEAHEKSQDWVSYTIAQIGSSRDYEELVRLVRESNNIHTVRLAAKALVETNDPSYNEYIGRVICDKNIAVSYRVILLQCWEAEKTSSDINLLYKIAEENDERAPIAIGLLINADTNITKLSSFLKLTLPVLKHPFSSRKVAIKNYDNLTKLAGFIRPWLHNQLLSRSWNKISINNYMAFVILLGDISTLDILESVRPELAREIGDNIVEWAKHLIRSSDSEVRHVPFF